MDAQQLVCPTCGRAHPPSERFCETCGMPLVHVAGGEQAASERQRRARKIKPQYAEGPLVEVARVGSQPEAEFIAGLLLEEGIPSMQRDSIGGYGPVAGVREVLVPESAAQAAREALAWKRPQPPESGTLPDSG
jgi:hypothetical protein